MWRGRRNGGEPFEQRSDTRRATARRRYGVHALAAVAAIGLLASACSSPSSTRPVASLGNQSTTSSSPPTLAKSDQSFLLYARCLRSHGIPNEPDPFHRPGHAGLSVAIPAPGPRTNAALAACRHFIKSTIAAKQAGAAQQLAQWLPQLTAYAVCMRSHDINMLDPNAQGSLNLGPVPGMANNSFGRYSPQFRAADSACRHLLPAAVHDDGTGP